MKKVLFILFILNPNYLQTSHVMYMFFTWQYLYKMYILTIFEYGRNTVLNTICLFRNDLYYSKVIRMLFLNTNCWITKESWNVLLVKFYKPFHTLKYKKATKRVIFVSDFLKEWVKLLIQCLINSLIYTLRDSWLIFSDDIFYTSFDL